MRLPTTSSMPSFTVYSLALPCQVSSGYYYNQKPALTLKAVKARTRMSSFGQSSTSHSSHAGRLESVETFVATSDKPETRDASFQTMCFRRDSYRCVVTGQMDTDHWKMLGSPKDIYSGRIGGTHIIPSVYATGRKSSVGCPQSSNPVYHYTD